MTVYVKILDAEGQSQHGGDLRWSLPVQNADGTWTPGEWHEVEGDIVPCKRGLHAVTLEYRYATWHTWDSEHYEIEFDGAVIEHGDGLARKYVGRRARLLRHIPHEDFWLEARAFVASLSEIEWFSNAGAAQPHWDVYETREVVWNAAWDETWQTAWEATRAAAWDAVQKLVRMAAWEVVWNAAWDTAWEAAGDAAWAAVGDEALLASCIIAGFRAENPHYRRAEARMDVWRAGYGLLGDYVDAAGNVRFIVYKSL